MPTESSSEIIERLARESERQKIMIEDLKRRIDELEQTLAEKDKSDKAGE